jgi:hypothetical protein
VGSIRTSSDQFEFKIGLHLLAPRTPQARSPLDLQIQAAPAMEHHGSSQGFTELLLRSVPCFSIVMFGRDFLFRAASDADSSLSMGLPGLDSGWTDREEDAPPEFRFYAECRSGESNNSGSGSGGGGSGELCHGLGGSSRTSTEDGAPRRTESPRSPESWGNR